MQERNGTHWWKLVASIILAAALLAYFLSRVPLADVLATIGTVQPAWLVGAIAASLASYAVRGLRWGVILRPLGSARTLDLLGCTSAGFAASTILPARAGEVIRPLLLTARSGLPAAGTLASVVTERLADLATVLVMFGVGVALAGDQIAASALPALHKAALLAGLFFLGFAATVLLLLRGRETAVGWLVRLLPGRFKQRGARFGHHVLDGLEAIRSPRSLLKLAIWSLAVWGLAAFQIVCLARAFGLELSLASSVVFMVVSGLGLAVPTPAGVGGFHAAIQFTLVHLFGVEVARATAFALLHHAVCFIPITIVGLGYVGAVGLSLGRLKTLQAPPAAGPES